MVRVKFRYLVANILYPQPSTHAQSAPPLPDLVQIHSPTPDAFHTGVLIRVIREGVEELYGEYGAGMVSAALKGTYLTPPVPPSKALENASWKERSCKLTISRR